MIFQPQPNFPWTALTKHSKTMELHAAENGGAAIVAADKEDASQESSGSKLTTSAPLDPSHTSNNGLEEPFADAALPPPPAPPDARGDGIGGAAPPAVTSSSTSSSNYFVPQIAKDRLSKWAARLFDPDRPKGVNQPPQTIPLNDEFLSAFGKREQEMDALTGQTLTIDRTIRDDDEDYDGNAGGIKDPPTEASMAPAADEANPPLAVDTNLPSSNDDMNETTTTAKTPMTTSGDDKNNNDTGITNVSRNVKISNLRFTTTQSELEGLCQRFGEIEKTTLIKNPSDETKNMGLAFVLFVTKEAAARCLAELTTIQNRPVTVTEAKPPGEKNNSGSKKRKAAARYWETEMDLSLKCYHCGLYGHMASACQNAKLLKPCTLCGVTSHDARNCDKKVFCFTCGLPGHPSRDCPDRHQPVRRLICTICYREDHHKSQCRSSGGRQQQYRGGAGEQQQQPYGLANAVCMVCGKLGHFSCQRVSVFYGLRGLCCCNWYVFLDFGVYPLLFVSLQRFIYPGFWLTTFDVRVQRRSWSYDP
jgi:hypothetical protein